MDRTTVNRIENCKRNVTVDDLGVIAAALNVPLPLLLLPLHDCTDVALTPEGTTAAVNPCLLWEWMRGEETLPGRFTGEFGGEWNTSAAVLWRYEAVRAAQLELHQAWPRREHDPERYITGLQHLVDAVAGMEQAGLSAGGLVADAYAADADRLGVVASPRGARYQTVAEVEDREAQRGEH